MAYVDGGKQALEEGMKVDIAVRECNMMDCRRKKIYGGEFEAHPAQPVPLDESSLLFNG